jgi:hypothetical protein
MYDRLEEVPVYALRQVEVSATHYNHVSVALRRLGSEIRLQIPRLKHLDLILQKNAWIIVDRVLNDIPIVAWTDFETSHRDNLHQPIRCSQRMYHIHAPMIITRTLDAMELLLGEQLQEMSELKPASVSEIRKDRETDGEM